MAHIIDWQKPDSWSVLIVDDEPDNVEIVTLFLEFLGATVRSADNGMTGLEVLQSFRPNLILLDLSMPRMDGWEMLRRIRQNPDLHEIWVIALTAHAMYGDRERVQMAGFNGYLTKPVDLPTLLVDLQRANFVSPPAPAPAPGPTQHAEPKLTVTVDEGPVAVMSIPDKTISAVNNMKPVQFASTVQSAFRI
jgi:CheY-like chemotaxis protein